MIALPLKQLGKTLTPDQPSDFRLLLNQFNERLIFSTVDKRACRSAAGLLESGSKLSFPAAVSSETAARLAVPRNPLCLSP